MHIANDKIVIWSFSNQIYSFYQNGGLDITTALIYDAVLLFGRAIHEYDTFIQVTSFKKTLFHFICAYYVKWILIYVHLYLLKFNKKI